MRRFILLPLVAVIAAVSTPHAADPPARLVGKDQKLQAAVVGPAGKLYIASGAGIQTVEGGKTTPFVEGLGKPSALASFAEVLYVADGDKIVRFDKDGKKKGTIAFPKPPAALGNLVAGEGEVATGAVDECQ